MGVSLYLQYGHPDVNRGSVPGQLRDQAPEKTLHHREGDHLKVEGEDPTDPRYSGHTYHDGWVTKKILR